MRYHKIRYIEILYPYLEFLGLISKYRIPSKYFSIPNTKQYVPAYVTHPHRRTRTGTCSRNAQSQSTTACARCAFPCAVPAARQCTSLRTGNYQPYILPNTSNHVTIPSPLKILASPFHKLHIQNVVENRV